MNLFLITAAAAHAQPGLPVFGNKQKQLDSLRNQPVRLLPPDYYSNNLSFFCRKELQVEKLTKVPFRIRLGSLDYVNTLEGKGLPVRQELKGFPKN